MRTFAFAALLALSSMAALMHAQGSAQRQAMQRNEESFRERSREELTTCALPDGSSHALEAVVGYEGQTYRCVEVFTPTPAPLVAPGASQTLSVRIAGWIKVQVP